MICYHRWNVVLVFISVFYGHHIAASPASCDTDNSIITSAVYNDTGAESSCNTQQTCSSQRSEGGEKCQLLDGRCFPLLHEIDLMQVYDHCLPEVKNGRPCPDVFEDIIVDLECWEGPVHDPCHYFHASLTTITLRRLWKPSPTSSSSAPVTSIHECQCRVTSDTLQEFELRAVNLYPVPRRPAQQPVIKVYAPETGILISVKKRSLPKGYTVPAQTLIVRFRKGDRRRSRQILFIKAPEHRVVITCGGYEAPGDVSTTPRPPEDTSPSCGYPQHCCQTGLTLSRPCLPRRHSENDR